jgi:hypothetical protein
MEAEAIAGAVADEGGNLFGLVEVLWCVDSHDFPACLSWVGLVVVD